MGDVGHRHKKPEAANLGQQQRADLTAIDRPDQPLNQASMVRFLNIVAHHPCVFPSSLVEYLGGIAKAPKTASGPTAYKN
jgi:hypothetical protein